MEAMPYLDVCRLIDQVCPHPARPLQVYSDATIAKVYFHSVWLGRSVLFVCRAEHWEAALLERIGPLPSQPTMSKRLRTVGVLSVVDRVMHLLGEAKAAGLSRVIDAKPLVVGNYSKDRDARRGRAAGGMARGYKVHEIAEGNRVLCWRLAAMNVAEQVVAAELIGTLDGGGYLCGDNGYDSNNLHQTATRNGHQLVAPCRPGNRGVYDRRRSTPMRLRALEMLDPLLHPGGRESFGQTLMRGRQQIERNFGHAAMLGMNAPPPWVRRPHRVALWTAAKLIFSMCRLQQLERNRWGG